MILTLSQAQERLAAFPGLAIDWTRPAEEACRVALAANDLRLRRAEVEAIHEALMAYAAHLSFQEGRDFELGAVKRATKNAWEGASDTGGAKALFHLLELLTDGLHHAEPEGAR